MDLIFRKQYWSLQQIQRVLKSKKGNGEGWRGKKRGKNNEERRMSSTCTFLIHSNFPSLPRPLYTHTHTYPHVYIHTFIFLCAYIRILSRWVIIKPRSKWGLKADLSARFPNPPLPSLVIHKLRDCSVFCSASFLGGVIIRILQALVHEWTSAHW